MTRLAAAYDLLIKALAVAAGTMICAAFLLVVADVAMRTFGFRPPAFTIAAVEYILLYFTLLAAPYLVRVKGHVHVDLVVTRLPARRRQLVEKFAYTVCIVTSLVFAYIGLELMVDAIETGLFDERSIDIPLWLLYAPMPGAFLLIAVEFARYLAGADSLYTARPQDTESI